jgi:SWI/SNF-related matrix-associated actin-dependent regulator 1 of chromatin subfamily A
LAQCPPRANLAHGALCAAHALLCGLTAADFAAAGPGALRTLWTVVCTAAAAAAAAAAAVQRRVPFPVLLQYCRVADAVTTLVRNAALSLVPPSFAADGARVLLAEAFSAHLVLAVAVLAATDERTTFVPPSAGAVAGAAAAAAAGFGRQQTRLWAASRAAALLTEAVLAALEPAAAAAPAACAIKLSPASRAAVAGLGLLSADAAAAHADAPLWLRVDAIFWALLRDPDSAVRSAATEALAHALTAGSVAAGTAAAPPGAGILAGAAVLARATVPAARVHAWLSEVAACAQQTTAPLPAPALAGSCFFATADAATAAAGAAAAAAAAAYASVSAPATAEAAAHSGFCVPAGAHSLTGAALLLATRLAAAAADSASASGTAAGACGEVGVDVDATAALSLDSATAAVMVPPELIAQALGAPGLSAAAITAAAAAAVAAVAGARTARGGRPAAHRRNLGLPSGGNDIDNSRQSHMGVMLAAEALRCPVTPSAAAAAVADALATEPAAKRACAAVSRRAPSPAALYASLASVRARARAHTLLLPLFLARLTELTVQPHHQHLRHTAVRALARSRLLFAPSAGGCSDAEAVRARARATALRLALRLSRDCVATGAFAALYTALAPVVAASPAVAAAPAPAARADTALLAATVNAAAAGLDGESAVVAAESQLVQHMSFSGAPVYAAVAGVFAHAEADGGVLRACAGTDADADAAAEAAEADAALAALAALDAALTAVPMDAAVAGAEPTASAVAVMDSLDGLYVNEGAPVHESLPIVLAAQLSALTSAAGSAAAAATSGSEADAAHVRRMWAWATAVLGAREADNSLLVLPSVAWDVQVSATTDNGSAASTGADYQSRAMAAALMAAAAQTARALMSARAAVGDEAIAALKSATRTAAVVAVATDSDTMSSAFWVQCAADSLEQLADDFAQ